MLVMTVGNDSHVTSENIFLLSKKDFLLEFSVLYLTAPKTRMKSKPRTNASLKTYKKTSFRSKSVKSIRSNIVWTRFMLIRIWRFNNVDPDLEI